MQIENKKKIVEELREKFLKAKVVITTDYKGLDVAVLSELRKKLREAGVEYKVVKNTLLVRASEGTDIALIRESFKGPSAVAISYDDPVAPAKVLKKFTDEYKRPEIKVGVLNGKFLDLNGIKALADLPSREILLARLLATMNGVPTSFVRVLNAIPSGLMNVLQALKDKKETPAAEQVPG